MCPMTAYKSDSATQRQHTACALQLLRETLLQRVLSATLHSCLAQVLNTAAEQLPRG